MRLLVSHLRLPFQLLLAPIFLLGAWLGGAEPSAPLAAAFLAVHLGLYGGITAFNSFYDQDEGPIGFLKHPAQPTRLVRDGALALQALALTTLALVAVRTLIPAAMLVLLGIAYSHPRWRWKARVVTSLATVAIGQGWLAFMIGYLTVAPTSSALRPAILTAALGATLTTLGLFPITQVYQIDEDRRRGDRTLPVLIGWRPTLIVAGLTLAVGVAVLALALAGSVRAVWMPVLGGGVLALWTLLYVWSRRFERQDSYANHDWALGLSTLASLGFWTLILSEWFMRSSDGLSQR